jgi:ECF sigma factor
MTGSGGAESPAPPGGFFPAVYHELRRLDAARLAGKGAGHSLDATDLVHEAYLHLDRCKTN